MGRSRRPPNRFSRPGSHNPASQARSDNAYASLAGVNQDDGQMNAHIHERFGDLSFRDGGAHVPNDNIPTSGPSRANNDIRQYFELARKPVAGGAWLDKPEIPSPAEIMPERKHDFSTGHQNLIDIDGLRPHRVKGAYESNEEYLSTKYELMREDCIRDFRECVEEVRVDPYKLESEYTNQSIGIYDPVYIRSLIFSPRGLATRVAFSLSRVKKHVRWDQSKRLITGTLVALSPSEDAFQKICILATVAARPLSALETNPPEIDLFFARPEDQEIDPMKKWIMVECRSGFFEASRHTLLALQHMMREPFPLSDYLVDVKKEVEPPAYIQHNPHMNLSSLVMMKDAGEFENVNILEDWPASSSHSLDKSQSRALRHMLSRSLAIVQGPPGTGKTFVSITNLKVMLDNLRKDDAPIIVTAQTNHAVDQILRHVMEFETNFIRLGGRSKDKDIKKRTLFEVRSGIPPQKQPGSQKIQATIQMRKLTGECQLLLAPLELKQSPLDHNVLLQLGIITKDQAASMEMESQSTMGINTAEGPGIFMETWAGRYLDSCTRPVIPDDFDWGGYEEEDFDEVEQLQELEAEAVARDDDDIEALKGPVMLLSDNHTGKGDILTPAKIKTLLQTTSDLTTIESRYRGAVYNYFMREVKRLLTIRIRELATRYEQAALQRKVGLWEEDVRILRDQRLIGCTTTGLSKYRALLSGLRPRVVLVEEAAETQEAYVTAACFPTLEHLILVGDHQQLRPHCQNRAFEDAPYFLNLSLFERLVENDVDHDALMRQRRMIPEIRRLLYPIYGDNLKDHDSVKDSSNRPPVEGMGGNNSFFFCHDWPEARDGNMSSLNSREANMLVGLFDYLVLNGVDSSTITVLTFYNGQRKEIIRKLRGQANLRAVPGSQVVTVDSYQGEENDIVLLSLVRSNKNHSIGFLSSDNRACVALSRAKRGFYIFGNAELLACESGTWGSVVDIMLGSKTKVKVKVGQKRRVGYHLPLECQNHGNKVWMEDPSDWESIKGGCDRQCGGQLPCGHKCPYRCHPFEHEQVNCMQQCSRHVESCGHRCVQICCDPCRCQICDRRTNGMKPVLKPTPNRPKGPSTKHNLSFDNTYQTPSNPVASSMSHAGSGNRAREWQAYTNGGAQADDARALQMRKEQEAEFQKTIADAGQVAGFRSASAGASSTPARLAEASPANGTVSSNTRLLIDIDENVDTFPLANAASSKAKGKGKDVFDLMD
ncbi:P-loop containing nucleoside triphosphate hydrolase protein [Dothidotthia symphoricarpi CBS 119687]|uniref:P-loop containing nucleoside triphosphate hydrolase protein n=1 Tax=Dothidotthia symphoricarpi CBS 119687 TaxID=1392245 RepID=A0A6A6AU89_9PLEO|nr:P-loop containing nucleoside triphosphate hydrolase protein [Dothidotthia symphoricarpi CBS 119687]KAF2134773.1 P-loop containing nucleoside triphosphate hydrolase protein [Dothidotthia symphoricarpi CBS 119687]